MKAKLVLIIFLCALGALALVGLLGGLGPSKQPHPSDAAATPGDSASSQATATPEPGSPPSVVATTVEEDRAARKQQDLDAINNALLSGNDDPGSLLAVESRLDNPDVEVRKAALECAVHLGNTNIIPRLLVVAQKIEDPREKVAFLDAIEYLQLPTGVEVPSDTLGTAKARKPVVPRTRPEAKPGAGAVNGPGAGQVAGVANGN